MKSFFIKPNSPFFYAFVVEPQRKSKSNEFIIRDFYFLTSLILVGNWEVHRILHPEICFKKYLKLVEEKFSNREVG